MELARLSDPSGAHVMATWQLNMIVSYSLLIHSLIIPYPFLIHSLFIPYSPFLIPTYIGNVHFLLETLSKKMRTTHRE